MRSRLRAEAIERRYISRTLSLPSRGELLKTWACEDPAESSFGKYSSPWRTLDCVFVQLSMKAACIWATAGPSRRKCESRQCSGSCACPDHLSAIPTPPVNPILPSTTRSLRCVRLLTREKLYHRRGWYLSTSTPAAFISSMYSFFAFPLPTQSRRTCTFTPARARSARAFEKSSPTFPDQ